ncbi:MAG TPA: FAD-dependent oxidoreductase [Haliangiales bacterium]|nr:FAD-dependent oxidoreductase [Haliangiales bacterium]
MRTVVVAGNGMTSARLCERLVALRRRSPSRPRIVVFAEEAHPAYDRVHLATLMSSTPSGGDTVADLTLHPESWYAEHGIELRLGDKVAAIHRDSRTVVSASGETIAYDRLVLATGSRPFVPALPGIDDRDVYVFRTLDDLSAIRRHARTAARAVVIGGGLLGLEAAKVLADLCLAVDVVEVAPQLMPRQLDAEGGALLRKKIEGLGIRVFLGRAPLGIERTAAGLSVRLPDRAPLAADLVVVAAGIRPRSELAAACGLALDKNGGIRIDDSLETSDPTILAIGECASHRGATYGLIPPGYLMADVAADRLTGGDATFPGSDMSAKLKLLGVAVACLGRFDDREAMALTYRDDVCYRKLLFDHKGHGRIVGAMAVGEWSDIDDVMELMETRRRPSAWARRQFPRVGRIRAPNRAADSLVCTCMRISEAALTEAVADGCCSVVELGRRTGAGTLCGSCKPQLARISGGHPAIADRSPALLVAAIAAAACVAAWFVVRPLGARVHALFAARHDFWAQVTGYSALGLCALGLVLSLRKRWRRFRHGGFERWRLLHAGVNALALAVLFAHTGLHLGDNLNRALVVAFLGAAVAGVAAAVVGAVAPNAAPPKRAMVWVHVILTWPLLALLLTHVFHAYYY